MAYDEEIAERIRTLLEDEKAVTEKKMFGGLAFLVQGKMAVAADSTGGVMVRVHPAEAEYLVAAKGAEYVEMRGRQMTGWLRIDAEDLRTKRQLSKWVGIGLTYARSLPAK